MPPATSTAKKVVIVGLQTGVPLKRAIMPNGGLRMVLTILEAYGYKPDPYMVEALTRYCKSRNDAVFDVYTDDTRRCRSSLILTGLPDAYGRGRIIGDYSRVALYGVDRLLEFKKAEKHARDSQMSIDIYFERDIENGMLTESQAQESINDFVIKLRVARFLRTREHDEQHEGGCSQVCDPACKEYRRRQGHSGSVGIAGGIFRHMRAIESHRCVIYGHEHHHQAAHPVDAGYASGRGRRRRGASEALKLSRFDTNQPRRVDGRL